MSFAPKASLVPRHDPKKLPSEIRVEAAGLPRVLRTVEDGLSMIDALPPEIARLSRWTFAKALLLEALKSQKARDLKTAARQLEQAISNERWS
jgi:hypothetical protein